VRARFERKKGLPLAVEALPLLRDMLGADAFAGVGLVLAGGYDERVAENAAHVQELRRLAAARGVADRVAFKLSFNEEERAALLQRADVVLYTPENVRVVFRTAELAVC
jgi:alpha-1,3/alpha-1,6-mannosyltransferase